MGRRNRILVPEAKPALDKLKHQIIQDSKTYETEAGEDQGQLTSRENGKRGGSIGGSMVRELVKMAEKSLSK